jgi:hypothetical protein
MIRTVPFRQHRAKVGNHMTRCRDLFIFVADPDKAEEARKYLSDWLRQLDGHPGYLGGFVLK